MNIPDALFTGKKIIHLTETESTNTYAMDVVAKTNPSEGTCVLADYQTGGKGQIGRYWHSEASKKHISFLYFLSYYTTSTRPILFKYHKWTSCKKM
jgi:BirA family biotin operon repressor/biotin-[acetyl-CoA-carboxylase] ligase